MELVFWLPMNTCPRVGPLDERDQLQNAAFTGAE